jgi:hypothetical protein
MTAGVYALAAIGAAWLLLALAAFAAEVRKESGRGRRLERWESGGGRWT